MMIGKYEIIGKLGEGGMGKVLLGYDSVLDCKVAIKTVRADAVDSALRGELEDRLLHEARAAAKLDHPGIVSIREFLREGDAGYIVMKFVQGKTLDQAAPLSYPADPAFALRVLRECAAALDHAHARKIVHRDIKPSNIMLDDETGAVQITDFGIARILDSEQRTEPGLVIGTFEYMAPERLSPGKVDGRADQFSLAVLAQRMLTGAPIYSADTIRSLSYEIATEPPPSAHRLNPALPAAVDPVLKKALAKAPDDRYPTCAAFVAALEVAFKSSPVKGDWSIWRFGRTSPSPRTESLGTQTGTTPERVPPIPGPANKAVRVLLAAAILTVLLVAAVIFINRRTPPPPESSTGPPGPRALPASLTLPTGDMVLVEGGEGPLGPERKPVRLGSFYIDRTEVTNQAYLAFCRAVGRPVPPKAEQSPPGNPVVNVTFDDAQAFAKWAGKRLPTASEWEKAARGPHGQAYPWGNDWREGVANIPTDSETKLHLEPADSFASGASAYGALNMLGNAWEWVAAPDRPDDKAFQQLRGTFKNLRPPLSRSEPMYQIRGGSFRYLLPDRRLLLFDGVVMPARFSMDDLGFRCVKDP